MSISDLKKDVLLLSDKTRAQLSQRYFKCGKGEYGEGDIFAGLTTFDIRKLSAKYKDLTLEEIECVLHEKIHEMRSIALVIIILQYNHAPDADKKKYFDLYLKNTRYINNWDLVDISAPNIIGDYLLNRDRDILYKLAQSNSLWERRIAIISTLSFTKKGETEDTFNIARLLFHDNEDLLHKAAGWMLREVGKRASEEKLERFLIECAPQMPRTMLRYAIERFPEEKRKNFLSIKKLRNPERA